jgi:hypothetical protein
VPSTGQASRSREVCSDQSRVPAPPLRTSLVQLGTILPNALGSWSDIWRRRSRNFARVTSSDWNAIPFGCDMAGLPAEPIGLWTDLAMVRIDYPGRPPRLQGQLTGFRVSQDLDLPCQTALSSLMTTACARHLKAGVVLGQLCSFDARNRM